MAVLSSELLRAQWTKEVYENEILSQVWGWRQEDQYKLSAADAARQFAEHLMGVTKTLLTCLEESGGWLFTAAG
eukprot:COSAG04_NODE_3208_length_3047_cov_70.556309_3_plen_74_part_00